MVISRFARDFPLAPGIAAPVKRGPLHPLHPDDKRGPLPPRAELRSSASAGILRHGNGWAKTNTQLTVSKLMHKLLCERIKSDQNMAKPWNLYVDTWNICAIITTQDSMQVPYWPNMIYSRTPSVDKRRIRYGGLSFIDCNWSCTRSSSSFLPIMLVIFLEARLIKHQFL